MNDELYDLVVESNKRLRMDVIKLNAERDALHGKLAAALDGVETQKRVTEEVADNANRWREVATGLAFRAKLMFPFWEHHSRGWEREEYYKVQEAFDELKAKENQP